MINKYLAFLFSLFLISCSGNGLENYTEYDENEENVSESKKAKSKKNKYKSKEEDEFDLRLSKYDTLIEFESDIVFDIKLTTAIDITEYYLPKNLIDSFLNFYSNPYEEALAVENLVMNANPNITFKDSSGLHLALQNGKWKTLIPNFEIEEFDLTLEYIFTQIPFYSVRVQWDEGNGYKLIHQNTGKTFNLFGRPYPSPDNKYIATVSSDINAGFSFNGIQLFKINDDNIELLASYEPQKWGPISLDWISNHEIVLKNETVDWDNLATDYLNFYSLIKISFNP